MKHVSYPRQTVLNQSPLHYFVQLFTETIFLLGSGRGRGTTKKWPAGNPPLPSISRLKPHLKSGKNFAASRLTMLGIWCWILISKVGGSNAHQSRVCISTLHLCKLISSNGMVKYWVLGCVNITRDQRQPGCEIMQPRDSIFDHSYRSMYFQLLCQVIWFSIHQLTQRQIRKRPYPSERSGSFSAFEIRLLPS